MTAPMSVTNLSLQRQIGDVTSQLSQIGHDIIEIKSMLKNIEERVRQLETAEAGAHPLIESRIDAAWRKLEEYDKRITCISDAVVRFEQSNRILNWLGGILGSAVLIWLVTQVLQIIK